MPFLRLSMQESTTVSRELVLRFDSIFCYTVRKDIESGEVLNIRLYLASGVEIETFPRGSDSNSWNQFVQGLERYTSHSRESETVEDVSFTISAIKGDY